MAGTYKNKAYSLRIDEKLMDKVKAIAAKEDRTANKQIEHALTKFVEQYEAEHGEVEI